MESPSASAMKFCGLVVAATLLAGNAAAPAHGAAHPKRHSAKSKSGASKNTGKKKTKKRRAGKKPKGQKAPTTERITEIQRALGREGAYAGEPNGKWDAQSVEAMKRFQMSQGLEATGKFDALSLQKLGLGSDIAGVAAPLPPAPASSPTRATSNRPES